MNIINIIKKILGKKVANIVGNIMYWDRINPWLFNVSRIHFLSLKYYVLYFIKNFVTKNNKILDFWCWNMIYKDFFLEKESEYYWLDIWESPENQWDYIVYEWGVIPFENDFFNIITCTQVFEHLENLEFYAWELQRVTKKWWYILLTIAHVWEYHPYPKHYQNVMFDIIPEIFSNSEIIEVKWDTTEYQNLMLFKLKFLSKLGIIGLFLVWINNLYLEILNKLNISKIGPTKYNPFTWNILIILKVK